MIQHGYIFNHRKINEGFNCIIVIVIKISVSPTLDKNNKHTTSFTFSKIYSLNVKNNINNNRKCEDMYCWIMYIDNDKNKMIKSDEMAYLYLLMLQKYLLTWLCSILWIYYQLEDSKKVSNFLLVTSWYIPAIHYFAFLTPK